MPKGRPIVSDVGSETYEISAYIDSFLQPLAQRHFSYIKNTQEFLAKVQNQNLPENAILVTADIESLYTNIDTTFGLGTIRQIFNEHPDDTRPDDIILKMLEICLNKNDFSFNGNSYLQIQGTAMGKRFAPSYANLALVPFDKLLLAHKTKAPLFYCRYIDDLFFVFVGTDAELEEFKVYLNSLFPFIKLSFEASRKQVSFLDTLVFKHNDSINTKVFFKETDTHLLLHKNSAHPQHVFKGIIKSQILRFKRICTNVMDFDEACNILFEALMQRGYKRTFLAKIKIDTIRELNNRPTSKNNNIVPILIPFSPEYAFIGREWMKIIRENYSECTIKPILAFTKGKTLGNYLVSAKVK